MALCCSQTFVAERSLAYLPQRIPVPSGHLQPRPWAFPFSFSPIFYHFSICFLPIPLFILFLPISLFHFFSYPSFFLFPIRFPFTSIPNLIFHWCTIVFTFLSLRVHYNNPSRRAALQPAHTASMNSLPPGSLRASNDSTCAFLFRVLHHETYTANCSRTTWGFEAFNGQ